jgi:DNA-binding NtrC family response regulator
MAPLLLYTSAMKFMIVDDDQYIVTLVTAILKKNSVQVVSHSNVGDALRNLMEEEFDGLIIDFHLPGMDGLTAIPLAKDIRPGITVGMMTGDASPAAKTKALTGGADFFIQKQADLKNLWKVVSRGLRKEVRDVKGPATGGIQDRQ